MAGTWSDIIRGALIEIGVKEPGEALDADELADSFTRLTGMFADWALEGLLIPGLKSASLTITSANNGRQAYTMGRAQTDPDDNPDIVTTEIIEEVSSFNYRRAGWDRDMPINPTSFAVISELWADYRNYPRLYYFDAGHPFTTIYFDANPLIGDRFTIWGAGHFPTDIEVTEDPDAILPPGYRETVLLNLAVKLAPSYGVKDGRSQGLSSQTRRDARLGKSRIKTRNLQTVEAPLDPALRQYSTSALRRRGGHG